MQTFSCRSQPADAGVAAAADGYRDRHGGNGGAGPSRGFDDAGIAGPSQRCDGGAGPSRGFGSQKEPRDEDVAQLMEMGYDVGKACKVPPDVLHHSPLRI